MSSKQNYYNNKKGYGISHARMLKVIELAGDLKDKKVLDIGCGNGRLGQELKKCGAIVHGCDISESALEKAKKVLDKAVYLDVESIDWAEIDNDYDLIIVSELIEHLFRPSVFLDKIKKYLTSDGELIITTPNFLMWTLRLRMFFGQFEYHKTGFWDEGHVHFYTYNSLKKELSANGFYVTKENHIYHPKVPCLIARLRPQLFAYQMIVKVKRKNRVMYTTIFGNKDKLMEPKHVSDNFDYICFTDQDFKSKVWQIKKVAPSHKDPARAAKIYKILPHKYLSEYEYSIFADGNLEVQGDLNKLIDQYLDKKNMATFDHKNLYDSWDCIYEEARQCIRLTKKGSYKEEPELMQKQVDYYREQGYPERNGLISGMILVRRHNKDDVVKTMEDWWKEIESWSRRDQLSFNYVAWKNDFRFAYIPGDSRNNEFFKHHLHLK